MRELPLTSKIILISAIVIGLVFTIFSLLSAAKYFYDNELILISDKYNTKDSLNLVPKNDTVFVNAIKSPSSSSNKENVHEAISKRIRSKNYKSSKKSDTNNYYLISKNQESFELGDIGDFLSGYFGVLMGFAGIAFTFIAFYVQYLANIQVQNQFRLQQFESQFQKMIDVYLNNKDKFCINGFKNPDNFPVDMEDFSGTRLKEKLRTITIRKGNQFRTRRRAEGRQFIEYITKDQIIFQKMIVELKVIYRIYIEAFKEEVSTDEQNFNDATLKNLFSISYFTFFYGLNKYEKDFHNINSKFIQNNQISDNTIREGFIILKRVREISKIDGTKVYKKFYVDKNGVKKNLWMKLNFEPFKGYMQFLPQYYRNLYSTVKFIVNENESLKMSEAEKLKYLRILRSTMSDYEQVLLFYNWYSGVGTDWEGQTNNFFLKYKMIHNIKKILLIDDEIDIYDILKVPAEAQNEFFENY